jgi:hypothetical protein
VNETRRRRARLAAALALPALLLAPQPAPARSDRAAELHQLLDAAGVSRHVQEWPELTLAARERASDALDADGRARLERGLAEAFAPEALLAGVAAGLAEGYDAARVEALLGWYDSPPGRRIRAAEDRATTPEALRELPVFVSLPAPRRVPPATHRAVQRIARATGLRRSLLLVAQSVSRGVGAGALALRCEEAEEDAAPAAPERRRVARLARLLPERASTTLLFAYRDVPIADLTGYAELLESDPGRWLFGALPAQLEGALAGAERSLRERLAAEAAPRCSAPRAPGSPRAGASAASRPARP